MRGLRCARLELALRRRRAGVGLALVAERLVAALGGVDPGEAGRLLDAAGGQVRDAVALANRGGTA